MIKINNLFFNVSEGDNKPKHLGKVNVVLGEQGEYCECCLQELEEELVGCSYEDKNNQIYEFKKNSGNKKILIVIDKDSFICSSCLQKILDFVKSEEEGVFKKND